MNEFNVGDAVRIKGMKGRPIKWIIEQIVPENSPTGFVLHSAKNPNVITEVFNEDIAPYKEYVKKEKIIDEQL